MTTTTNGIVQATSLSDKGVSTGLLRTIWEKRVYLESLQPEPFFNNEHLTNTVDLSKKSNVIAKSCFVDMTQSDKGARKITKAFLRSIADEAVEGNATAYIGQESNLRMKYASFYANDYGRPVASQEYGIDRREMQAYQVYEQVSPLLWQWLGEYRGFCARHAIVENISHNLTAAPISLTATLNSHIWFPINSEANQPAFLTNASEYTESVGDCATVAGESYTTNQLSCAAILDAADFAARKYLMPVEIAGKSVYLMTASPKQALRLSKPSIDDSLAKYWVNSGADLDSIKAILPDVEGMVGNVVIVKDMRAPTIVKGGSNSSWTLTIGYMRMGRTDGRTSTLGANAFDVNMFLGKEALGKYESEMPHFEKQYDDYDRFKGDALIGAVGYQTIRQDIDTPADSDKAQQEGSMLILTNRV